MVFFSETSMLDDEEEFPFKRRRFYYDTTSYKYNAHSMRFLSHSYIRDLSTPLYSKEKQNAHTKSYLTQKSQQVIYKNISRQSGQKSLRHLMQYLARDLSYQDANAPALLYGSDHTVIDTDDIQNISKQFSNGFTAMDFENENSYLINRINKKNKENQSVDDMDFDIWRVGTVVKRRNDWAQECIISEIHGDNMCRVEYQTPEGQCSDYINRKDIVPITTPEGLKVFNHSKAKTPDAMLIASDDHHYSIHKKAIHSFERHRPYDFHHLMFSVGGNEYNLEDGHQAFRDFLDESFKNRGFDFIYSFHNDIDNPHYHVICKDKSSLYPDKKFPRGKGDSLTIRRELNEHLFAYGIERSVTKFSDRIFATENQKSLEDKINDYPSKNSFKKKEVYNLITTLMDEYYPYALEHKLDIIDHLNDFDTALRYSIDHAKKKDIPSLVKTSLESAKNIDEDLYKTFMIHLKYKPQSHNNEQIKDNRKRLLKNLSKTKEDIEIHPYSLSERQQGTSDMIDHLIEFCQAKAKKKEKDLSVDKGKGMTR